MLAAKHNKLYQSTRGGGDHLDVSAGTTCDGELQHRLNTRPSLQRQDGSMLQQRHPVLSFLYYNRAISICYIILTLEADSLKVSLKVSFLCSRASQMVLTSSGSSRPSLLGFPSRLCEHINRATVRSRSYSRSYSSFKRIGCSNNVTCWCLPIRPRSKCLTKTLPALSTTSLGNGI